MAPALDSKALFYMSLLAVQFGMQPILSRNYTPTDITRSTVIFIQEVVKFVLAVSFMYMNRTLAAAWKDWTLSSWLRVACIPAGLYAVQNFCALLAYQTLDALTYNVLNQTKTLSAALNCYLIMGKPQSQLQMVALCLLLLSALVIQGVVSVDWLLQVLSGRFDGAGSSIKSNSYDAYYFSHGVLPLLLASYISGLAGALTQKSLQAKSSTGAASSISSSKSSYMFTAELCVATWLLLLGSMLVSPDGTAIVERGFWHGWTPQTLIPIVTNGAGGILVGLVTQHAGSVRKGFALIFGIFLSGLVQGLLQPHLVVTREQILGGALAAASLYLHAAHPPPTSAVPTTTARKKTAKLE